MNYWLLTTEFPPIHGGGISTYCWHTAKMLSDNNYNVTIFINDYSIKKTKTEASVKNIRIIRFNPNQVNKAKALGHDAKLSLEFANIVDLQMKIDGVPDIIESQDYLGIAYYILQKKYLLYNSFKDLKVVITMHAPNFLYLEYNQFPLYKFPEYWTGEMEKACIKMADLVISPSNYLIDQLKQRMDISDKNIIQVFNPFNNEWSDGKIPKYTDGDIVFFGKLTPQKGCLEMLSYLKQMWDNGFTKSLSIIGGGEHFFYPMQEDMQKYINKKYKKYINKGLIIFEGNMPPHLLKERIKKAHIIITPSIIDNLPYAILEAMSMGKLVLSSANGGHTEIMKDAENGFIFKHEIKGNFENKLSSILNLKLGEVYKIGEKAQKIVEDTTNYKIIFKQKSKLLNQLIKNNTSYNYFPFINKIDNTPDAEDNKLKTNLLSIVIPYYNMGKYILETLNSLSKITYTNNEIIIINDGSDDINSINILSKIKQKYSVTIYDKENEGLSLTRNYGAKKAKGKFLAFLDADDMVSPDYYTKSIEVLKQYSNISFIGCWAEYFGEDNIIWPTFNPEFPYLLMHNMVNSSALVYKTKDFIKFGQNDEKMIYGMEDYDSVISMVKNGARGLVFPELWWQYRIRKNSMQQLFTKDKELYLYRLISNKHKELFMKYGKEISDILNHNGSGIKFNNPSMAIDDKFNISQKLKLIIKKNKTTRKLAKQVYNKINN